MIPNRCIFARSKLYYNLCMYNENTPPEVAIIGSGYGFQEILPAILSLGYVKVNLMKPRDYSDLKYKAFELPNVSFASLDEIANRSSIKIVFIAVPPFLQFNYFEHLAPFGKSIYLEKPGGLNSKDAMTIKSLSQKYDINLYLGFQFRFDPILQMSMKCVDEFATTAKKSARITWNIKKSPNQVGWKQDLEKGGGVYRDHLCHMVDLLRNSFGFSDDCFGPSLQLYSGKQNLIDHVNLKSANVEIDIHRDYRLNSDLQIVIEAHREQITIKNVYPFKLRSYSVIRNTKQINLPDALDLDLDARQFALKSYISQVLADEFGTDATSNKFKYPSIEDAIFTQKIADQVSVA